jgi:Ran GTPase-activating protein (RanGAP) involved in mRNA processing and transport
MTGQEAIRDMMNSMASGNASEVQDKFNAIMQGRATDALSDFKQELATSVFKNPDLQAMGLSDGEEHVHEIDPAEGPQPVEGAPA